MSELTKQALKVENNQSFPNNNAGLITPSALRTFNENMIDSTVNQEVYTADSASFNTRINNVTGSVSVTTGSLLTTASFNDGTRNLTFTKGDGSTFAVNIPDVSGSIIDTGSFVTNIQNTALVPLTFQYDTAGGSGFNVTLDLPSGVVSGSEQVVGILSSVNAFTQSQETKNTTLGSVTASLQQQLTNIGSQSGSWVTESETGSFARVNVTNTFTQDQIIQGTLTAYTMSADTLNVRVLHTTIESSSVIFSSGSNVLGDASDDVQTLNGSVRVVNELTASGLNYPNADNGAKSFIQTDGNGNLSLQYVDTIWESFYAGESVPKGTPLYFSGSQGANPIAYAADAADVNKMPVVLIAGDNLTAGNTYEGIVLGLIEGLDLTGYTTGQTVYVAEGGGWSTSLPSGSNSITQVLGIVTKGGNGGKGLVLNPGPAQLPGLQTGYAWVGDGGNQPVAVPTSSFAENTDLGPLNAFTASQELLNTTFATTGSNSFLGNQIITGSVIVSSSDTFDIDVVGQARIWAGTTNVQTTISQTAVTVTSGSGTPNSTMTATSVNVRTALANAIGLFPNPSLAAASGLTTTQPSIVIGRSGPPFTTQAIEFTNNALIGLKLPVEVTGSLNVSSTFTSSLQQGYVWVGDVNGRTTTVPTSSFGGGGADLTSLNAFTASQELINSGVNTFTQSADSRLSNLELFTSSQETLNTQLLTASSSFEEKFNTIGTQSGSWGGGTIDTGSFATTGSNTFVGNQVISGSTTITGSLSINPIIAPNTPPGGTAQFIIPFLSGSSFTFARDQDNALFFSPAFNQLGVSSSAANSSITPGNFNATNSSGNSSLVTTNRVHNRPVAGKLIGITGDPSVTTLTGLTSTNPAIILESGSAGTPVYYVAIQFESSQSFTDGRVTITRPLIGLQGSEITGSVDVSGNFTASLQQGYVWVGDANGRTITVSTGSFGGGGSAFPFTGDAQISGSLGVTGSMSGFVNTLGVTSQTASVNFNDGNMFVITLPTGSVTHITPTNIKAGQTINIQISQAASATTGSVTFSPNVRFAGGNDYQATATGSAIDLLTFVSLDGTNVLGTSIKNFL